MSKVHNSFGDMLKAKIKETERAMALLNVEQRAAMYQRWITFFAYEDLVGDDVDAYSSEWGPNEVVAKMFEADPVESLFQFLLNEGMIDDGNHATIYAANIYPSGEEAAARIAAMVAKRKPASEPVPRPKSLAKVSALMGKKLLGPRGVK